MTRVTRRQFTRRSLQGAALLGVTTSVPQHARGAASDKVVLALIGAGSRGRLVAQGLAAVAGVEFRYVCELEETRAGKMAQSLEKLQGSAPRITADMRRVFDDREVHGVVIATPEQWHALATVWACQAGKDVYVEKCISRHVEESRKMVQAARRYRRIVQVGTQHRSGTYSVAARQYIRDGKLGDVFYVKVCNLLPSVYGGYPQRKAAAVPPPPGFDWDQWLGPAPARPYDAQVHRNWHGYWDFSGGNSSDGIHQLDLARMVLGEPPHPQTISCMGGRWQYADGGEMPDVQVVTFQWDKLAMTFENNGFSQVQIKQPAKIKADDALPNWLQSSTRIEIYGTKGTMFLGRHFLGWQVLVPGSKVAAEQFADDPQKVHFQNFVDCIRTRNTPNADVEPGHMGACLEHLGNIAYRLGNRRLTFDPQTEKFIGDAEADRHLAAAARKQYRLPDVV
jgi:predicted dehydrogenase